MPIDKTRHPAWLMATILLVLGFALIAADRDRDVVTLTGCRDLCRGAVWVWEPYRCECEP